MKIEHQAVAITWIPSEAVRGMPKGVFQTGLAHYDDPPPDALADGDLERLRDADRFRFANVLRAWIDVDDGHVTGYGYSGGCLIGSTNMRLGPLTHNFQAFAMPDLQLAPEVASGSVRFVQTGGGRTGAPAPRRVLRPPFVQWRAPLAWTTLALTLHVDGRAEVDVVGASRFPRHWVYGPDGALVAKSGLIDFKQWWRRSFGRSTPWGREDSPAIVTACETAMERELSSQLMKGGRPTIRKAKPGAVILREGEAGDELVLVLDGVVRIDKGGRRLAELGPGAVLGERAVLEGGTRTSTATAVTACRLAVARADQLDPAALLEVSRGHRREEQLGH